MGVTKDRFIKIFKGKISQELYDTRREKVRSALERFKNAMAQIKALEGPYQVLEGTFGPLVARFINNDKMAKLGSYPRKQAYEALDSVKDESRDGADDAESALANTKKFQDMCDDVDNCLADCKIAIDSLTEADPENGKLDGFKDTFDDQSGKRSDIADICENDHQFLDAAIKKMKELKALIIAAEKLIVAEDFKVRDWTPENSGGRLVVPGSVKVIPLTDPGIKLKAKRNTTLYEKMDFSDSGTAVESGTNATVRTLAEGYDVVWVETYSQVQKTKDNGEVVTDKDDNPVMIEKAGPKGYGAAADFKQHKKSRSHKARSGKLFERMPSVDDIQQGALGDCYLVAALAAVAKQSPNKIGDMIVDNGDGTCTVRLYDVSRNPDNPDEKRFDPVYVKIDKSTHEKSMGLSERAGGALWVQMIEKAYAAYGAQLRDKAPEQESLSYKGIEGGWSNESLEVILGKAATHTSFKDLKPETPETLNKNVWPFPENLDTYGDLTIHESMAIAIFRSTSSLIQPDQSKNLVTKELMSLTSDEAIVKMQESGITGSYTIDYDEILGKMAKVITANNKLVSNFNKKIKDAETTGKNNDRIESWEKSVESFNKMSEDIQAQIDTANRLGFSGQQTVDLDTVCEKIVTQMLKEGKIEGPSGSGQYTTAQSDLANDIKEALDNKKAVCAGTPSGKFIKDIENVSEPILMKAVVKILGSGEGFKAGIIATHAYTVVGIEMPDEDTVAPIFVNLRNPWGHVCRKTVATRTGSLESKIQLYSSISRLELGEFTRTFDDVEFC